MKFDGVRHSKMVMFYCSFTLSILLNDIQLCHYKVLIKNNKNNKWDIFSQFLTLTFFKLFSTLKN